MTEFALAGESAIVAGVAETRRQAEGWESLEMGEGKVRVHPD